MNSSADRLPTTYTLPAQLVADIWQLLQNVPSGVGADIYVRLRDEIARQNQAATQADASAPSQPFQNAP